MIPLLTPPTKTQASEALVTMVEQITPSIPSTSGALVVFIIADQTNDQPDPNPLQIILAGQSDDDPNTDGTLSENEEE